MVGWVRTAQPAAGPTRVYTPAEARESTRCVAPSGRGWSVAQEGFDLVAVGAKAHEGALVDHDGGNPEPAHAGEELLARVGILADVADVDGHAARLEKRERCLAVRIALQREQERPLHVSVHLTTDPL